MENWNMLKPLHSLYFSSTSVLIASFVRTIACERGCMGRPLGGDWLFWGNKHAFQLDIRSFWKQRCCKLKNGPRIAKDRILSPLILAISWMTCLHAQLLHGRIPSSRAMLWARLLSSKQMPHASHHFDVQTRKRQGNTSQNKEDRNTMQKSSPKQCTLWFGSCPGSAWCGCWCTSTSTPTHDPNIERCAKRTISWCSVIGLKTSWSKHGIHQLFIKLKLRPGPTNWSKRTQFLQTKQKLWSNQSWSGVWCQLQLWHLRDVDAKAKHSSVINIDLWIYAYIAVYCKYEASHTQMERHPRSCPLSSKHVGIASYPRSYYFPFSAHRRWYPLEAPGGWKQPIKQGIIRDSSRGCIQPMLQNVTQNINWRRCGAFHEFAFKSHAWGRVLTAGLHPMDPVGFCPNSWEI